MLLWIAGPDLVRRAIDFGAEGAREAKRAETTPRFGKVLENRFNTDTNSLYFTLYTQDISH